MPGAGEAAAGVGLCDALMVDGLPMAADKIDCVALCRGLRGFGVGLAESPVEAGELGGRGVLRVHGGEHCFAQCSSVGKCAMAEELDARASARGRDAAEGDVDAVCGGAAHDAGDQHRLLLHARACRVFAATWSAKASTDLRMAATGPASGGDTGPA